MQKQTAVELAIMRQKIDTVLALTSDVRELELRQAADEQDRATRDASKKTLSRVWKVTGAIVTLCVLPIIGWAGTWLMTDYGRLREAPTAIVHLEDHAERGGRAALQTREATRDNRDSIRRVEGRLDGIEESQVEILKMLRSRRRRRR